MVRFFALTIIFGLAVPFAATVAQPVVADLSSHQVAITSSFTGEDIVLFGVREGGGDVIVIVRGPPQTRVVRQKQRVAGIWVNRDEMAFSEVPGYYAIAATRPLDEIADPGFLIDSQIGPDRLQFQILGEGDLAAAEAFRAALIRSHQQSGLYATSPGPIGYVGGTLFRTEFHLPAGAPVGTYSAVVYLLRDGELVGFDTTPLFVTKAGLGRAVYDYAHAQP
ncbi:MAG: TIGR02186 family protein, partial [Alphaproteobacteria bacterium]|nr:TIGR02186 family protein [Alphaproteobacteria bacterium]